MGADFCRNLDDRKRESPIAIPKTPSAFHQPAQRNAFHRPVRIGNPDCSPLRING
jgi:hypothetical protein